MKNIQLWFVRLWLCEDCVKKLAKVFPKDSLVPKDSPLPLPKGTKCELCPLLKRIDMEYLKIR